MKSAEVTSFAQKETGDTTSSTDNYVVVQSLTTVASDSAVGQNSKPGLGTQTVPSAYPLMPALPTKIVKKTKHPISHNTPKVGRTTKLTSSNDFPSVQASNLNLIIERSNNLCDRWHGLGLGKDTGTIALNEYVKRRGVTKRNGEPYSTAQMVQMFDTLIPKTVPLPPDSQIKKMMIKAQFGEGFVAQSDVNSEGSMSDVGYKCPLQQSIAGVYELISTQPNFLPIKKRKIHHLDGDQVIERLKSYENRFCDLREKEANLSNITSKYCSKP